MYLCEKSSSAIAISRYAMIALSVTATALILWLVLKYSFYGIDFTDESFYLVWMSNPFIYEISASQFGFVYHPLYLALHGSVSALRQANILVTFGLGWVLACGFLRSIAPGVSERRLSLYVTSAGLATSTFISLNTWMPTPNYNGLALQALMLTSIGLLRADSALTPRSIAGWIIIGVGGWLAFMAKPSTAVALAVGVSVCLVASRKFSLGTFVLAATTATCLLLLSAFFIDGSISDFARRILLGIDSYRVLGSGQTVGQILRIDGFRFPILGKLIILLFTVLTSLAIAGALSRNPRKATVSLVLCTLFFAITVLLIFWGGVETFDLGEFEGVLIFGVSFAAVFSGLLFGASSPFRAISASQWSIAILFIVMPYIYAFGTNRNYWENAVWAGIFWLLAGITMLGPVIRDRRTWSFILPLVLATQAITAFLLHIGLEQPYRQDQAIRLNGASVEIGPQRSVLVLSAGYAAYLKEAMLITQNSGFISGTPLIDLTGQSPGILFAIGAESIGQPWIVGGYPGSSQYAKAALDRVSCEKIARAWVLTERDGPRGIPGEIMTSLGAAFPGQYEKAGTWWTAEGAGGYPARRLQELYRPAKAGETLDACRALRAKPSE